MIEQEMECDVVVVGGGGAGLATADQAAQLGLRVILVEKNARLGGSTARSVGSISASCTSIQRKAGVNDSVDSHFHDMGLFAGENVARDNTELRRVFVENSGPTFEWLRDLGVVFFGPMPEPPHSQPRMHNVLPNSSSYIHHLEKAARKLGVRILKGTSASELFLRDGAVAGLLCETKSGILRLHAKAGVVLAAGDFSSSKELKKECIGELASLVPGINPTSTGDGIRLGLRAGGRIVNGDLALGPELRFHSPPGKLLVQRIPPVKILTWLMQMVIRFAPAALMRAFVMSFATSNLAPTPRLFQQGAILVNRDGQRFTDETDRPWLELPKQESGEGYIVFDGALSETLSEWPNYISTAPGIAYAFLGDYQRNRRDIFHSASSVEALAASMSVPADNLTRTISELGWRAPYVALGPLQSWIVLTEGGLAVDSQLRVLNDENEPIDGLFAAGSNGQGGLLLDGHGNHIGWAVTSGRIAARSAAQRLAAGRRVDMEHSMPTQGLQNP